MIIILSVGTVIRLVFAPFTTANYDVSFWMSTIMWMESGDSVYSGGPFWYPPTFGYILAFDAAVLDLFNIPVQGELFLPIGDHDFSVSYAFITNPAFNLVIKLPMILADAVVAVAVYLIAVRITNDQRKGLIAASVWFFCPLVIWMSSIHGQFDCIAVMFMALSVLLVMKKRYFLCGVLFGLSVVTKVLPIVIAPLMMAYILSNDKGRGGKNALTASAGFLIAVLAIYLPVIMTGEISDSFLFLTRRVDTAANISVDRFVNVNWSNILYFSPVIVLVSLLASLRMYRRKKNRDMEFVILGTVCTAVLLIFPFTAPSTQYALLVFPLAAPLCSVDRITRIARAALAAVYTVSVAAWATLGIFYPLAMYTPLIDPNALHGFVNDAFDAFVMVGSITSFFMFVPVVILVVAVYRTFIRKKEGEHEPA